MAPRCYIIHDPNSALSRRLLTVTESLLLRHGYSFERFAHTDGKTVTDHTWRSLGIRRLDQGKWVDRPGAWGCFISHFRLWQQCRDRGDPMIVLEHDALAQRPWSDLDLDQCLWKLWKFTPLKHKPTVGSWNRGAWAYTLTPSQANQLISFTEQQGALALDKQIGTNAVDWQHSPVDVFLHNPERRISTTNPPSTKKNNK